MKTQACHAAIVVRSQGDAHSMARGQVVESIAREELGMEQRRGFGAIDVPAGV